MVCWLCSASPQTECGSCQYLESLYQPVITIPTNIHNAYNSCVGIEETVRLSKIYFLENHAFKVSHRTSNESQKREREEDIDDDDRENNMEPDSDNDSDDDLDALWSTAGKHVRKKQRLNESEEELIRKHIESTYAASKEEIPECVVKLLRFIRVLEIFNKRPKADIVFEENESVVRMLIASYLKFIVGEKDWEQHRTLLYPLIESTRDLSTIISVAWTTCRQQGKSTVLARVIAALSLMSPVGGELVYIYSTSRDRAQGVLNEAKLYLEWVNRKSSGAIHEQLRELGLPTSCYFKKDNTEMYTVECWSEPGTFNTIKARPQRADSCRGDAPSIAVLDEVAFVDPTFWEKFAMPLLAIVGRVFTLATTPPRVNSFYDDFLKKQAVNNANNEFLFTVLNHNLMCDACFKLNKDACHHKLYYIPPWKSTFRIKSMCNTVTEKGKRDFQAEVRFFYKCQIHKFVYWCHEFVGVHSKSIINSI